MEESSGSSPSSSEDEMTGSPEEELLRDAKKRGSGSEVQAVLFDNALFDTRKARAWLTRNKYEPIKRVHRTTNYLRYRIKEPEHGASYRIIDVTEGIKFVIAFDR